MASITVAEKCAPITRAAAKRRAMAAALVEDQQLATKKRAVLGDLTNLTNPNFGFAPQKPKCETKKAAPEPDNEDPQLCGSYASDIYAYLRRMEVLRSFLGLFLLLLHFIIRMVLYYSIRSG